MRKNLSMIAVSIFLTGCAAGASYQPTTKEGAQCKVSCSHVMANCQGSSYSCDRAASTCMQACKELEMLNEG